MKQKTTDAGYTSLFLRKTLNGWRNYQNKPPNSWMVKDGTLYFKGSTTDKSDRRADLITVDRFENFDLQLDWKISPQGKAVFCTWLLKNIQHLIGADRNTG